MPGLGNAVRSYRLQQMREFMSEHRYDALAFTTPDWFEWAGNVAVSEQAWERPFLLVVPMQGQSFALMSEHSRHKLVAERDRGTSWIDAVTHYSESPAAMKRGWTTPQWREMVADSLCSANLGQSSIGADALGDSLTQVAGILPGLKVAKAGAALRALRWVKHPDELATMRICASLSDWAMGAYREELRPGRLLDEVDHVVAARLARESARRLPGENYVIGRLLTLSGVSSACPHGDGASSGRVLENDTIANTTIATKLNGLSMELSRPWLVGAPSQRVIQMFDSTMSAQDAAIEAAVAGRPVSDIHAAAQQVFDRWGFGELLVLRSGHGIGVVMHDFPEDVPFNSRPLLPNEAYAIEPGLYVSDVGAFRFADTIVVHTSSPEHLTKASKDRIAQTLN